MNDLMLVVADKTMEFALKGALGRPESLGIRPIKAEFVVHTGRDGGVRKTGSELLSLKKNTARYGLLLLDYEGCGTAGSAAEVERDLNARLELNWGNSARALVIQPELDIWMWGSENALQTLLSWKKDSTIRGWLNARGFKFDASEKPSRPKEALEAVLREIGLPYSAALYRDIAEKISLRRCNDPAFCRLRETLRQWFPI